jgi:hypothetical protein
MQCSLTATFKFLAFCGAVLANFTAAVTFLLIASQFREIAFG